MRRAGFCVFIGALFAIMVWSSALAFGVSATINVNGKTTGPVTITIPNKANTKGVTNYDSWIGPVPYPTYGCFLQSIPYLPFKKPVITGGDLPVINPVVATNEVTGKTGWNFRYKVNVWGNASASMNSSAVAEYSSGSTTYHITSGTGIKDCGGSGNLQYTSNPKVQVITKN